MKRFYLFCSILAAAIICSCSNDITEESKVGNIVGSVSDRTTGEPVATVNVSIVPGGSSTVTGSDGSFSFVNLESGEYTLSIRKEGYTPNTVNATVKAGTPTSVHMTIDRIPASITADKTLLDFGENLTTLSFTIVNSGYTDLAYRVETGGCEWLSTDPEVDILGFSKTATIVANIDRSKLPVGNNEATIVVRSTSGNGNVEVKVVAVNNAGASVNTLNVTNVANTSASLNGEITNPGQPSYTERGFVYDTQSTPTVSACIKKLSSPVTSDKRFSCNIDGLSPIQTYYARAYIIQNSNTIYGNIVSFTTSQQPTTLSTSAVTQIGASTATFNASILDIGAPAYSERGFCFSKGNTPTIADNRKPVSGSGAGDFSLQVTNLDYPVTYYVRAYAIQAGETVYGNIVSFTTNQHTTSITTSSVTQVTSTTATFNASISDAGLPAYTERGFCYSTNGNPNIATNRKAVSGSGTGSFSLQVSGLDYPITYYVCAYAIQDGNPIYGNTVSFTTEFRQVSVSTSATTEVSTTSAKLNGVINDVGSPAYTQRGFCYSNTNSSPTIANDKVVKYISSAGSYNETVSNLQAGTTYYVRAFAVQDDQYVYGNTISFTTTAEPTVRTDAVTSLTKVDQFGGGYFYQWCATFNATVLSVGSPAYNGRGFVYSTTSNPTVGNGTNISLTGSGTGKFSTTVNNLSDMQTYYIRAYVKVGSKYYYGESVRFTTY
ncbi:MAG: carboxypeptidase regulatory-like domain-containing protein [Prevotellaceae bacterium]|nr:carboxypeptidase regulatory-like domain-containing protein [Prevotellaceae bacterium]